MKTQIEQLIDRLDQIAFDGKEAFEIYIGDVLDAVQSITPEDFSGYEAPGHGESLVRLWGKCGSFAEALQEIFDRATWEWSDCRVNCPEPWCFDCEGVPKQPEIRALFEHLLTLGI